MTDIVLVTTGVNGVEVRLYDPKSHRLLQVEVSDPTAATRLLSDAELIVPREQGVNFFFVANIAKASAYYHHHESLIWRDVGALIGVMSLVAEAMSLNFCPLGSTGEPFLSKAFGTTGTYEAVGGAVLGSRKDSDRSAAV